MGAGTDVLRQDIDALRDSMSETIVEIEDRVKGSVETTVEKVKHTFDLRQQVIDQPLMAVGVAVVLGFVVGNMGSNDMANQGDSTSAQEWRADVSKPDESRSVPQRPNVIERLSEHFSDEIDMLTSAGVAMGVSMLRDTIQQYLPRFGETYQHMHPPQSTPTNDQLSHNAYAANTSETSPRNGTSAH